ncbi:MAG TPA: Hsp20/alpha crystallin family protein [Thermoanaerobaculia bacterium]|nr:Hsp20/alpha crystallin family protein [Thermoanaerobaculia bacterium]
MAGKYASMFLVSRFQSELERLFQEALAVGESSRPGTEWQPTVDIVETPGAILVLAEVPGMNAADLTVEVKGTLVTLTGTKSTPLPTAERIKFQCVERGHGRFVREVQLFWPVNSHGGTARLQDGLLTIEFPKVQEKRQAARRLQIEEIQEIMEPWGAEE